MVLTLKKKKILQTSASLKFTVLNPKGRIWTMVAGGGASVIYADTVGSILSTLRVFKIGLKPCNFELLVLLLIYVIYCPIRLEILALLLSLEIMQNIVEHPMKRKCCSMPE